MTEVRQEQPTDIPAIREVNRRAFGQDQEGNIVDALRTNRGILLSLVAVSDDRIVGHILYSPAVIGAVEGGALGPMSVLPEFQRRGIGTQLVESGNRKLMAAGCPYIIVLGHPGFYPRFGFEPASTRGIACEWEVPDDVFMVLALDRAKVEGLSGIAKYRQEFSTVS